MDKVTTPEEFLIAAKQFASISDRLNDGWTLVETGDIYRNYLKKETFIKTAGSLLKAEFIVFYNLSYGVPSFSFNMWYASGTLLTLEDVRQMAIIEINQRDFYSVITQQEHPILGKPYFVMHPCHTEHLLSAFRSNSKNTIVTFLGLITPLLPVFSLSYEYGL